MKKEWIEKNEEKNKATLRESRPELCQWFSYYSFSANKFEFATKIEEEEEKLAFAPIFPRKKENQFPLDIKKHIVLNIWAGKKLKTMR